MKIELHKQFKVPVDGLNGLIPIAEEIEVKKKKKKKAAKNAYEEDTSSEEEEVQEEEGPEKEEKELNPRKAHKKLVKAEKKEKRAQKKELKVAFKTQGLKLVKQNTAQTGQIRPGVSVKKIN